ncbi:DALR anticodon-binding domain-containing protein 3 [Nymphon striatum]|nr:DALR anticodon-binding domain-containing protein 3 [Nymphon striatum]
MVHNVENNKNQKKINVLRSFMESIIKIIKDFEPNHQYRIYKLSAKRSDIFDFRVHSNHLSQVDPPKGDNHPIADEIYKQCQQFLRISQVQLKNDVHFIKIDRCSTFNTVLRTVNSLRTNYGKRNHNDKVVIINPISRDNQTEFDILRSYLIAIFVERFLASSGYKTFLGVKKKFSEHIQVLSGNFFQGNFDDERKELISQVKSSKYVFEEADCIKLNARRFFEDKTAQAALDLPLFDSQINEIPLIQNGVPTSVLEETINISNMTLKLDSLEACRNEAQYKYGNDIDLISWDHTLKVLSDANIKFEFLATKCSAPVKTVVMRQFKKTKQNKTKKKQFIFDEVRKLGWKQALVFLDKQDSKEDIINARGMEMVLLYKCIEEYRSMRLKIGICLSKSSGPKGKFVIYNYARISMMLSKFYQLVNQEILKDGSKLQLGKALTLAPESHNNQLEWKLLFDYVLFFPHLLQEVLDVENLTELPIHKLEPKCVKTNFLVDGGLHSTEIPHFLLSMSEDVSSYYSKVHLLTKPLNHLMPTMYARLYLMMAVKQVMHNALCIMNIAEVQQM